MGRAIAISIAMVVIIAIIALALLRAQKTSRQVGDLDRKQEQDLRRMVDKAARVMNDLFEVRDLSDLNVLSNRSQESVDEWLRDYAVFIDRNKEINA